MDDQRANRESGGVKRFRISLRLMLLLVAALAVVFAWIGARRNERRANLIGEIRSLEIQRRAPTAGEKDRQRMFSEIDSEIAKRNAELGVKN
jgi:hypothetical protein